MKQHPLIPFSFDPGSSNYETHHLKFVHQKECTIVKWPLIGVQIIVPPGDRFYSVESVKKLNGDMFKDWDLRGFTLGSYHEFFCYPLTVHACFKMSGVEVTFGHATPLAACLYDGYHDKHFFDSWDDLTTARILGARSEVAEAIFINAAVEYQKKYRLLPQPMHLEAPEEMYFDQDREIEPETFILPPPSVAIEPLRFHYNGLLQIDAIAACIYFYRVIEHFSFLVHQSELSKLRHDEALSDSEFSRRVLDIAFKDEKGPVLHLVNRLADKELLDAAVATGLIKLADSGQLGQELYAFRNAIVHGKVAAGYVPEARSVVSGQGPATSWSEILRVLSERSIHMFARRLSD